ncbi:MAG: hypothetical protein ACFFBH_16170 [Promethearchaeota archaeon]
MRKNVKVLIIALVAIFGGGALAFFITGFATSGTISESFTFNYQNIPLSIEDLNLNVDLGSVDIKYNTTNTPYIVKIDVDLTISGLYMTDRQYTAFFKPAAEWWQNTTSPLTFNMKTLTEVWFNPAFWFKSYNIDVTVLLRTDVKYDIKAITGTGAITINAPDHTILNGTHIQSGTGSLGMTIGDNVLFDGNVRAETGTGSVTMNSGATNFSQGLTLISSTGSLNVNIGNNSVFGNLFNVQTSTGGITVNADEANFTQGLYSHTSTGSTNLYLYNCLMGDDLSSDVSTGGITYYSYNMQYSKNIAISLKTSTGSINADIYQYIAMGANVSGTIETSTGGIDVFYRDSSVQTGVRFVSSTSTGAINYTPHVSMEIISDLYQSNDYNTATSRYLFSLTTSTGNINVNAQSP